MKFMWILAILFICIEAEDSDQIKPVQSADEFYRTIQDRNAQFTREFVDRNFEAMKRMYTEDCKFMPQGMPIESGREGAERLLRLLAYTLRVAKVHLETQELHGPYNGDTAWERNVYWFEGEDGTEIQRGKNIVIWKKDGDEWFYHIDMINTDRL